MESKLNLWKTQVNEFYGILKFIINLGEIAI